MIVMQSTLIKNEQFNKKRLLRFDKSCRNYPRSKG